MEKETSWNLNKPGAWQIYKEKPKEAADKLEEIITNENNSIEDIMKKLDKQENKAKYTAFGKTRNPSLNRKITKDRAKLGSQTERDLDILKRQSEQMEKEILNVKETRKGRVGQVFKMKEKVIGNKKSGTEPHAVKDPKTGELLVANEDIKKATLNYCVENLEKMKLDADV